MLLPAINPLTGLAVDDPAVLARRPLAAKISNAPDLVRPQAGIAQADLVFEHLTEGPLTRFTAIFWTHTPPRVGSIRSARLLDLEIPAMYDTLLVYSGASEPIRRRIAGLPFADHAYEGVTVGPPLYYRDTTIEVPHNLFAVPSAVWARAEAEGVNRPRADLGGMHAAGRRARAHDHDRLRRGRGGMDLRRGDGPLRAPGGRRPAHRRQQRRAGHRC